MTRTLHCRDAGFDCDAVVRGESDEVILEEAGQHVKEVHGQQVDAGLAEQLRPLIRAD
jgi:predicted small metal-binding protein